MERIIISFLIMMLCIVEISSYQNGLPIKLILVPPYKSRQKFGHISPILNNYGLTMHQPHYSTSKLQGGNNLQQGSSSPLTSLAIGVIGLLIILMNRVFFTDSILVSDVQSRADLISVMACSALLLNVLSEQDITAGEREAVPLIGDVLSTPFVDAALPANYRRSLEWLMSTALSCSPSSSALVVLNGRIVSATGIVATGFKRAAGRGSISIDGSMIILKKAVDDGEEVYLPDLQILPGKVEFSYLPINAQTVVLLPLPILSLPGAPNKTSGGALILAANRAKVFKFSDLARLKAAAAVAQATLISAELVTLPP